MKIHRLPTSSIFDTTSRQAFSSTRDIETGGKCIFIQNKLVSDCIKPIKYTYILLKRTFKTTFEQNMHTLLSLTKDTRRLKHSD